VTTFESCIILECRAEIFELCLFAGWFKGLQKPLSWQA